MRFIPIFYFLITLTNVTYSQHFGVKGITEISNNKKINGALGFGGYLLINDYSKKSEILLSTDYCINKRKSEQEKFISEYKRFGGSISFLFIRQAENKLLYKAGPNISFNKVSAKDRGLPSNWIQSYVQQSIGIGCVIGFQSPAILKLPIYLDFFAIPSYLLNIHYSNSSGTLASGSNFSENLLIIQIQAGLSYDLTK